MKNEGDITLAQMVEFVKKRKFLVITITLLWIIGGVAYSIIMGNRWFLIVNTRSIDREFFLKGYFASVVLPELKKDAGVEFQTELTFSPGEENPKKQVVKLKFMGSREAVRRGFEHLKDKYIRFKIDERINELIKEMEEASKTIDDLKERLKLLEREIEVIKTIKSKYPVIKGGISLNLSDIAYFPPQLQLFAMEYQLKTVSLKLKVEGEKLKELERRLSEYRRISSSKVKLTDLFCGNKDLTGIPWDERQPICLAIDRFEAYPLEKIHTNPVKLSIFWGLAGLFSGVFLSLFIGIIKET